MNGRRAIVGLCMLCALALSAVAAQSASALVKSTTMFTCTESAPTKTFGSGDCNTAGTKFGHVAVAQDLTTHVKFVNTNAQKFKSTVAGAAFTLESNGLTGTGSCFNRLSGNVHSIQCSEIKLKYTGVTVSLPEGNVCGVTSAAGAGNIETTALKSTTVTEKMMLKLEPEVGTEFASWTWTGASCPFTGGVKVVGSIECEPSGAELVCTHEAVTGQAKLRLGSEAGPKAGYEGRVTITGGEGKAAEGKPTNPISSTTVETA